MSLSFGEGLGVRLQMKQFFTIFFLLLSTKGISQMKFHWRQYSGPVQTMIQNPDSPKTLVTGLKKVGIYGYEFSVKNDFGECLDSCTVTVIGGTLSISRDSIYHLERPKITRLEIKTIVRSNDILLQIKSPGQQQISCMICDITGRGIAKVEMNVKEGVNYVSLPKPRVSGIYILRFITYFEGITKKVFI